MYDYDYVVHSMTVDGICGGSVLGMNDPQLYDGIR